MSAIAVGLGRKLAGFALYAYRTLVLYFFIMSLLRFALSEGGWINYFIVFLFFAFPFAIAPAYRRLRRKQSEAE